jgi:hypothetical protein
MRIFITCIIKIMKSRDVRWAGHVTRIGRRRIFIGYWLGSEKERDHKEDQDVGGCIMLRRIMER